MMTAERDKLQLNDTKYVYMFIYDEVCVGRIMYKVLENKRLLGWLLCGSVEHAVLEEKRVKSETINI